VASLGLALAASGCDLALPGKPDPADRPKTPAEVTSFEHLFARNCSGCHGADGTLGPAPPLADPLFLAIISEDELVRVISDGRGGTPMPAFARKHQGNLTDEQIRIIAEGLKKHWKKDVPAAASAPEYAAKLAEQSSPDAVKRGAELFAKACADCHGADGEGTGPEESPGRINDPALLSLMSNQGLRRIVITGRHDLGMPNYADDLGRAGDFKPLTSDDVSDLVALLASWRER
jgi:mono/diheme cytochrome c family protein